MPSEPGLASFEDGLVSRGLSLSIGATSVELRVQSRRAARDIADLYAGYPVETPERLCDLHISMGKSAWQRALRRPAMIVTVDGERPFNPMPDDHALPAFESAINWSIWRRSLAYLILHAGVVEKDGQALLLPGASGSGKSTLCAALANAGWRLLSDEFAMIRLDNGRVQPHPRPISLKNESISVVAGFAADVHLSRIYHGTAKGDVAFMRPSAGAIAQAGEAAVPRCVVFPRFHVDATGMVRRLDRRDAFLRLMNSSTNYFQLMQTGFETLCGTVAHSRQFDLEYATLEQAISHIEAIWADRHDAPQAA